MTQTGRKSEKCAIRAWLGNAPRSAWNRSGLALLVAVAIMLRRLWPLEGTTTVVIIIILSAGAILWAVGMLLSRRPRLDMSTNGVATRSHFRILTLGTLVLALAGFLLGLLSLP